LAKERSSTFDASHSPRIRSHGYFSLIPAFAVNLLFWGWPAGMFMVAIDNAENFRNELHLEEDSLSQGSKRRLGLAARLLAILFTLTY